MASTRTSKPFLWTQSSHRQHHRLAGGEPQLLAKSRHVFTRRLERIRIDSVRNDDRARRSTERLASLGEIVAASSDRAGSPKGEPRRSSEERFLLGEKHVRAVQAHHQRQPPKVRCG